MVRVVELSRTGAARAFRALSAVRGRRSLHPVGVGNAGRLVADAAGGAVARLLVPGGDAAALIRFSRGAGLPEPLPDALGVAVKLPDAAGPGADQDLLFTSSFDRPLLRRLLFPARSFVRRAFSTALPYQAGAERVVLVLVPLDAPAGRAGGRAFAELRETAADGGLRYSLRAARSLGPSRPLATLEVGPPLDPGRTEALRFHPRATVPGLRLAGWLNALRGPAYRGSQHGRPAD